MAETKEKNLLQKATDPIFDFFEWVEAMLSDEATRNAIYADLGLTAGATAPVLPQAQMESIKRYRQSSNPDKQASFEAINDVFAIVDAILAIAEAAGAGGGTAAKEIGYQLLNLLLLNYLRHRHFFWYKLGQLVRFIEDAGETHSNEVIFFDRLPALITGVDDFFAARFSRGLGTEADAKVWSDNLFPAIAGLLAYLGKLEAEHKLNGVAAFFATKNVIYGWEPAPGSTSPVADQLAARTLSIAFDYSKQSDDGSAIADALHLTLLFVPRSDGGPGLLVSLGGVQDITVPIGKEWLLKLSASAKGAFDFLIGSRTPITSDTGGRLFLSIEYAPDQPEETYVIPDRSGTRLEFGQLAFIAEISQAGASLKVVAKKAALIISSRDCDPFTKEVLATNESRIDFNLGLGISSQAGFFLEGGSGLQTIVPIGRSLGPLNIQQLLVKLAPTTDPKPAKLTAELAASLNVKLGPMTATIDQLGLQVVLPFERRNNQWDFAIGLRPPNGIGLAIDGSVVQGGGFLYFDSDQGQYAGAIHLNIQLSDKAQLAVKALGLLSTKLPNGKRGFSLVVIITAEGFKPIPIGFGFMLKGIGGLLGVNRSANQEALLAGVKNRTLDSILFPKDPVRNAPAYLSTIATVFPPTAGRHLFGPMLQITWGTPEPIVTINLAIILEFGGTPNGLGKIERLIVLGQVTAILPRKENDLVRLQADAVGIVDFTRKTAAFDAALYDSRIFKKFVLTGQMAMRMEWGDTPNFALAVGGFHPAFQPPENFPKLERVAITMAAQEKLDLRCEAYFAITANSVQFGGQAEIKASAAGFSVVGSLGINVLIQFDPFYFIADFHVSLQLRRGSRNLFKVKVEGEIAGPRPLHVRAKASFEIFWVDISFRFEKTLISGERPPLPEPIDVASRLLAALSAVANWTATLDRVQQKMVTLQERGSTTELAIHPASQLTIRQNVVPLDTEIQRFGSARPSGKRRFAIANVLINNIEQPIAHLSELFAPAQFFDLTDDEKLSRPSFEPMRAGLNIGAGTVTFGTPMTAALEYEEIVIDPQSKKSIKSALLVKMTLARLEQVVGVSAVGQSELRRSGNQKYQAPTFALTLNSQRYTLASLSDLSVVDPADTNLTYSEARARLRQKAPAIARQLQIVPKPK